MARKLRTGFELPFSNATGSNQRKQISGYDYVFNNLITGLGYCSAGEYRTPSAQNTTRYPTIKFDNWARTLSNGTRGCYLLHSFVDTLVNDYQIAYFDVSQFTSGFYMNCWIKWDSVIQNEIKTLFYIYDNTTKYSVTLTNSVFNLNNVSSSSNIDTASVTLSSSTWYNLKISVTNAGVITADINGNSVTTSTGVTFSSWTTLCALLTREFSEGSYRIAVDDLAINDGSGASDNSTPNSIRGINMFDAATLNTNSGFTAVGGTTVLANLQDGDDSTRARASADLSYIDFSLTDVDTVSSSLYSSDPTTGDFAKIEAINVYGRQIEATKASSLLKAKVTDTIAVVNREENLSLPLTVGNDSVTMFDDGSSDWVLANLDSGDMDFRVTFDKP